MREGALLPPATGRRRVTEQKYAESGAEYSDTVVFLGHSAGSCMSGIRGIIEFLAGGT